MFYGLTMVNFDGQTQNQMMVRPWSAMVDHGQPWSDGQTVAGELIQHTAFSFCFQNQASNVLLMQVRSLWEMGGNMTANVDLQLG